ELRTWEPRVLHFLGHGEEDGLWFESTLGGAELVSPRALGRALRGSPIRLVLLNACWSAGKRVEGICEQLTRDGTVQAAVRHPDPIPDATAILFAERFYRHLIAGVSVEQARNRAVSETAARGHPGVVGVKVFGDGSLNLTAGLALSPGGGTVDDGL